MKTTNRPKLLIKSVALLLALFALALLGAYAASKAGLLPSSSSQNAELYDAEEALDSAIAEKSFKRETITLTVDGKSYPVGTLKAVGSDGETVLEKYFPTE